MNRLLSIGSYSLRLVPLGLAVLVLGGTLASPGETYAQAKNAKGKTAAKGKSGNAGQERLKQARQLVAQRANDLTQANNRLKESRKKLEQGLKDSSKLAPAKKKVEDARKHYETVSGPILDALRNKPEYKTAVAAREKAREELKQASKLDDETRKKKVAELSTIISAPGKMESDAVASDPNAKSAYDKLQEATKDLGRQRASVEEEIRRDAGVNDSAKSANQARQQLDLARKNLASVERTVMATPNKNARRTGTKATGRKNVRTVKRRR